MFGPLALTVFLFRILKLILKLVPRVLWTFRAVVAEFLRRVKYGKTSSKLNPEKGALTAFIITSLIAGSIMGLIAERGHRLAAGLIATLIVGLSLDGSAIIKHFSLRLILWFMGYTPLKLANFLDYCSRIILLKKVGGGYIFVHRLLLEYLADRRFNLRH